MSGTLETLFMDACTCDDVRQGACLGDSKGIGGAGCAPEQPVRGPQRGHIKLHAGIDVQRIRLGQLLPPASSSGHSPALAHAIIACRPL